MNPTSISLRVTLVALAAGMISFGQAASVQFTIDSSQTQVTLSGTAAGLAVEPQGEGSLTTSFEGTIAAEVTDDTVRFVEGSQIDGVINGNWRPMANGASGTAPADFGAKAGGGFLGGDGALRDLFLDLVSDAAVPLNQGQFNADGLRCLFPESAPSAFDYRVTVFISVESGRELLAGYATNRIATAGTLTTQDNLQVLEIPIAASITFELLEPDDSTLTISGKLRATRPLEVEPELIVGPVQLNPDGTLTFTWSGGANAGTEILSTTNLENWSKVADIQPGVTSWSVEPTGGAAFYRVFQP
jgi:hypothetical protein